MTSESDERLDPRQVRTRARVLAAARTVLRRDGLGGATIDAIATEAGVARSTVYRNWTTREDVLAAAFDDAIGPPSSTDDALPVRDQLERVLRELAGSLSTSEWGRTLPAVVAAIDAEPSLAGRYGRLTQERRAAMSGLLTAAIGRGELPQSTPVDDAIDALVGPLFYRRLIRQTRTSTTWISNHLDRTLLAFGARRGPHRRT
jgi:TetR/AcrR family transcriptional regulator, regulator of autoinduction and epiphytic fitness